MRAFIVVIGSVLALLLAWSTMLAFGLPENQAIAFAFFGACIAGMLVFAYAISSADKRRHHD